MIHNGDQGVEEGEEGILYAGQPAASIDICLFFKRNMYNFKRNMCIPQRNVSNLKRNNFNLKRSQKKGWPLARRFCMQVSLWPQ